VTTSASGAGPAASASGAGGAASASGAGPAASASGAGPAGVPPGGVAVRPGGPLDATVAAPTSKSVTNRLLVLAALADGDSLLRDPLASDDSAVMRGAVAALGADVDDEPEGWRVRGTGGRPRAPDAPIDAGLSGTTMRFVAALATLAPAAVTVTGDAPLRRRPVGPLVDALRALGAAVQAPGGYPPVLAQGGGLHGGEVTVDATRSSQFASAVLMVAPYADQDVTVRTRGLGAGAYVDLTVEAMGTWGAHVEAVGEHTWTVAAGRRYRGGDHRVEYDASAAAHLLAFAVATGGRVTVTNASPSTLQPDARVTDVFAAMGAQVTRAGDALTVVGSAAPAPFEADLRALPDQVTTVAALAALAHGVSTIRGAGVARTHETDRLAALATELRKLGIAVDESADGLRIAGGSAHGPARLATYDDHRLAMAFAALAARIPDVVIGDARCVTKTYPRFWSDLAAMGVPWEPTA
jgi:3-phosphoshikimate 1-carboxyvinyltransferase